MERQGAYDILLTDCRMPKLDGPELVHRLKRTYPKIDVIMMTGFPELETAVDILKQGAYDYLLKPIDIDALSACLNRCWEKRSIEAALADRDRAVEELTAENERLKALVLALGGTP
jgi:DNA-binding NtrC family response regulator